MPETHPSVAATPRSNANISLYICAIFLSAFLLFAVQPMLGKLLLPHLGGSPTVWNTAMMVYQALLLGGYAYAHFIRERLGRRTHIGLHLGLLAVSLLTMPLALVTQIGLEPTDHPALWVVLALLATVGLPFFLLAANAPLIQSWFANSGHPKASNPYFLYAASNLGSFLALLSYPLVIERFMGSANQLALWSIGYGLFALIIGLTAWTIWRAGDGVFRAPSPSDDPQTPDDIIPAPSTKERIYWVALAFIPSSLLLGVTHFLTTDIAAFPLLWVMPLALYLLTFVLAFSRFNEAVISNVLRIHLLILFIVVFTLAVKLSNIYVFLFHLLGFALIAYVCHGQLAAARPHSRHLTEFYLWISVGGVLGGIWNAVIAPTLFTGVWEYPLALLLACLLRPKSIEALGDIGQVALPNRDNVLKAAGLALLVVGLVGGTALLGSGDTMFRLSIGVLFLALFGILYFTAQAHPLRLFAGLTALIISVGIFVAEDENTLYQGRNFFGTIRVIKDPEQNIIKVAHGTTMHGFQSLDPEYRLSPTSYYVPLKQVFAAMPDEINAKPVAVVGLGAGTIACFGKPGQAFDLFEIDPEMVAVAQNTDYFTYLSDCPPEKNIIVGDARLSMEAIEDRRYGMIILDAFSSDSVPVHLVTREAIELYLEKLQPGGLIAANISNRYIRLRPVFGAIARDLDLDLRHAFVDGKSDKLAVPSNWIILTRKADGTRVMSALPPIWKSRPESAIRAWTDDFSNVAGSVHWMASLIGAGKSGPSKADSPSE